MVVPIIIYTSLIFHFSVNIPIWDDYDTVLAYLNKPGQLRYQSFFYQHNEHKIAWIRLVIECYYFIFGEINFIHLIYIGNLALIFTFALLVRVSLSQKNPVILFLPVSYLMFQPQAWENMTWATGSLQNFYIFVFALLSFNFWNKKTLLGYISAIFFGVVATYTSANGLLVFFVLIAWECKEFIRELNKLRIIPQKGSLFPRNRLQLLFILLAATFLVCYSYFHNYGDVSGKYPYGIKILLQPLVLFKYITILLGSYMEHMGKNITLLAGLLEVFFVLLLAYKEYDQKNPVIYYFLIFVLLSIFVTALGRAGLGVEQAFSSRYRSLSIMGLVIIYLAFIDQYPKIFLSKLILLFLIFSAMAFNFFSTTTYLKNFSNRKEILEEITKWKQTGEGLNYPEEENASLILRQSIEKGLYKPPGFLTTQ